MVTALGGVASAEPGPGDTSGRGEPGAAMALSPDQIEAYWTKERMRNAEPMDAPAPEDGEAVIAGDTATGPPGIAGGYMPASVADGSSAGGTPTGIGTSSTGVLPGDGGYPGPHTTWEWFGKYRKYPISTVAKVFFTTPSGGSQCSGSVIFMNAAEPDQVWTAGHCVAARGSGTGYYSNFLVCPSYDSAQGGVNPNVGCWAADFVATTPEFIGSSQGWWSRDYAHIDLDETGTVHATNISAITGGLGFAWNHPRDQHWMDFGYPAEAPYSGGKIWASATEHRYDESFDAGPAMNSYGSTQNGGSSGGPLIVGFSGGGGFINSNNSLRNVPSPVVQWWGPYFDGIACSDMKAWTAFSGTC